MDKLIQNAVYCTDTDTYHSSRHRHDFVSFESGGQKCLFIDGGLDYQRGTVNPPTVIDWCLYENSSNEEIKEKILWGTRGINGTDELKWIPLSKCETLHLQNILSTQYHISKQTQNLIKEILTDRGIEPVEVPCFDDLPPMFEVNKS